VEVADVSEDGVGVIVTVSDRGAAEDRHSPISVSCSFIVM